MLNSSTHPRFRLFLALVLATVLSLALWGCGGDDDDDGDPGQLTGPTTADEFDQALAMGQSQAASVQAVAMVESMTALAAGINKAGDYGWNESTQRWEWRYQYSEDGGVVDWFYTVQYLDSEGVPQESSVGAASVDHRLDGTGSYHYEADGMMIDHQMDYYYDTMITGLGSDLLTLTGSGGYDFAYEYHGENGNMSGDYEITWATVAPGITQPAAGGCPAGTIRYDFPPFYALVVFDGSGSATSTLYNTNGSVVQGGGSTHSMYCGME